MRTMSTCALAAGTTVFAFVLAIRVEAEEKKKVPPRPPREVVVVNPSTDPVSTNIIGTPTVGLAPGTSVGVSGSVGLLPQTAVGIDPANNTVQVSNAESDPVPVRSVGPAQPFQVTRGFGSTGSVVLTSVPPTKRLVIEHVSLFVFAPPTITPIGANVTVASAVIFADVRTSVAGTQAVHSLAVAPAGQRSFSTGTMTVYYSDVFAASHPMRVYADAETDVIGSIAGATAGLGGLITISGYLEDIP